MTAPARIPFPVEPQAELRPGMIEFRWGDPDPALLPVDAIAAAARAALHAAGPAALNYGANEGPSVLRAALAERIAAREGRGLDLAEIVITGGTSQAVDQLLTLLLGEGDVVLVEDPTYSLMLRMARDLAADLVGVPIDDEGLEVEALPEILAAVRSTGRSPRVLYTVPTFHNPTGVCLGDARRRRLLEVAAQEGVIVVEDDVYRELAYDGPAPASLWSMAPQIAGAVDKVVRLGTFSKTLAPGLRCGWLTAPPAIAARFAQSGLFDSGGCPSQFTACICAEVMRDGVYDVNVAHVRAAYAERCRALAAALKGSLPQGCTVTEPRGGFFTWVTLPHGLTASRLLPFAEARGVSFFGDARFSVSGAENGIRLGFSMYEPERLREGAARLGEAVAAALAASR